MRTGGTRLQLQRVGPSVGSSYEEGATSENNSHLALIPSTDSLVLPWQGLSEPSAFLGPALGLCWAPPCQPHGHAVLRALRMQWQGRQGPGHGKLCLPPCCTAGTATNLAVGQPRRKGRRNASAFCSSREEIPLPAGPPWRAWAWAELQGRGKHPSTRAALLT